MNLVDVVNSKHESENVKNFPIFRSGDTVAVHVNISEGEKARIQVFKGVCIGIKARNSLNGHFRVRKMSGNTGVERVFPFHSPAIKKIDLVTKGKTKRAKHLYLRERSGKSARIAVDYDRK